MTTNSYDPVCMRCLQQHGPFILCQGVHSNILSMFICRFCHKPHHPRFLCVEAQQEIDKELGKISEGFSMTYNPKTGMVEPT